MKPTRKWTASLLGLALLLLSAMPVMAQPPIPHADQEDGVSYEDCVYCHRPGRDGAPALAADHAQHDNADCRVCHGTTGMLAPNVSHPVSGWEDCRGCHDRWDSEEIEIPNLADSDYDHTLYESDTCTSCHPVAMAYYDEVPAVACGVCHPESSAAETAHNGRHVWVDCVECHQAASSSPHDMERIHSRDEDCTSCHYNLEGLWTSQIPSRRHSLREHISVGDPHASSDCVACHLQEATVERDPITGRIQVVLPEAEEGVPPDNPELAIVTEEVYCQRCHLPESPVPAPASELPPRSVLCLMCHDGSPIVRDGLSGIGIGIFGLGMVVTASVWLRGSVRGRRDQSLLRRIWRVLIAFLDLITTPRLFVLIWSFIVDGVLHRNLFRRSKLHWMTHAFMFLGMGARMVIGVLTWLLTLLAPTATLTQVLVNKSAPAVALLYDSLGLLVIIGATLAVVRRYVVKDAQFITGSQDSVAIVLIGGVFVMGFVVEGVRIIVTSLRPGLAAFSFVGYVFSVVLRPIPVSWGLVYGWLWYIHAGLVAALVAYLPFSKFIHVLIGPVVAALNSALKARIA